MHGPKRINPPRDLRPEERAWLQRLLLEDFPGRQALIEQAKVVKVAEECGCGCPSVVFALPGNVPKAEVLQRVPVEAESRDADEMGLHLLLHVVNGVMRELEIYREDSKPVKKLPSVEALTVFAFRPARN